MVLRFAVILLCGFVAGMSSSPSSNSGENFDKFTRGPEFAARSRILRNVVDKSRMVNGSAATTTRVLNRNSINTVFEERTRPNSDSGGGGGTGSRQRRQREVSILGLFELSTRHGMRAEGQSELAAAQLAVQHINRRGLLLGYTLKLLTNDTKVGG